MKRLLTFFAFLFFLSLSAGAQTFPLPGATWIFKPDMNIFVHDYAEKWEYAGDSITADGIFKKLHVTVKTVYEAMDGSLSTSTDHLDALLVTSFSGDTISGLIPGDTNMVCNFALTVGDSSNTPYYSASNMNFYDPQTCSSEDSLKIFRKGVVTATGIETTDGIASRYYDLKFIGEYNDTITERFSERSIITSGYYWHAQLFNICNTIFEGRPLQLICFFDDSTQAAACPELQWFEELSVPVLEKWNGSIFPNPVKDQLHIVNPGTETLKASISDLDGRIVKQEFALQAGETVVDLPDMKAGMYVLHLQQANGKVFREKFVIR